MINGCDFTEKLFDILKLAYRQRDAVYRVGRIFKSAFDSGFSLKKIAAVFIAVLEMFGSVILDLPVTPSGQELNLDGYRLVFCDEFDGDTLDTGVWFHRAEGPRRNGANSSSQVKLENGNMIMTSEYLEDGEYGAGWYSGMIALRQKYLRGYFEIRCKCNDGGEFWSAFWIQAEHPYEHDISNGGTGGAELDIFESVSSSNKFDFNKNYVTQTIHCNGVDDDEENIDSRMLGKFKANDIYNEYNTYGLEWTEDEYIFYINGVETARSSFGKGVSEVEETVIVSLEIPNEITHDKDFSSQFVVDYVKIWQKD